MDQRRHVKRFRKLAHKSVDQLLDTRAQPILDVLGVYVYWAGDWTFQALAKTVQIGGRTCRMNPGEAADLKERARVGFVCVTKSATNLLLVTAFQFENEPFANRGYFRGKLRSKTAPK